MRPHPFNELLRVAYDAAEAADLLDVDSRDPASWEEWQRLQAESDKAEEALVQHILDERWRNRHEG